MVTTRQLRRLLGALKTQVRDDIKTEWNRFARKVGTEVGRRRAGETR